MCLRYTKQTVKDLEDIKTFFSKIVFKRVIVIFKRVSDPGFHYIEKCGAERITEESIVKVIDGAERITEESIVKVIDITPETVITVAALRDQAEDVWVPFQIPAKGMENHDKTGSEIHGLILLEKQLRNNAVYSMKKTVKQGAVNTMIWEAEYDSMEEAVNALKIIQENPEHDALLEKQICFMRDSYVELYQQIG